MDTVRRTVAMATVVAVTLVGTLGAAWAADRPSAEQALQSWYKLVLELVRHTPTYSPPVASRSFAYLGVSAYEAIAGGSAELRSFAGQLNGLKPVAPRDPGKAYDEAVVLNATMTFAARNFFANTGPTGQRVIAAMARKMAAEVGSGVPDDVIARSEAYGRAAAEHIFEWSETDGGATIENMGFPLEYELAKGPAHWAPTSLIRQQQFPLLPNWGKVRTFAMPSGGSCPLPPPPEYSEDPNSEFFKEAMEVYKTVNTATPEQKAIARFWSDDPMLSPTPPGHWISIALQTLDVEGADLDRNVEVLAVLGVALADSFIGCWEEKYRYNLVRPITVIRRLIDKTWDAMLITPPFPEYPSGHSTQSGAAAVVLTQFFGENFAFVDHTAEADGLMPRTFPSFWAAAEEAGMSRLYGGIHFRAAIVEGLRQGQCIGAHASALKTGK